MVDNDNIKLLDNYQLYQILKNDLIDQETRSKVRREFESRKVSSEEMLEIKNKFELVRSDLTKELDQNIWNPVYTAFAFKRHFKHLALLQTQGKKEEAKKYLNKLYLGIVIGASVLIILILIVRAK